MSAIYPHSDANLHDEMHVSGNSTHSVAGTNQGYIGVPAPSAVSWGAILAGAIAAAALILLLLLLGSALGLSTVSPKANEGIDASTFGITAIFWLTLTHIIAFGIGGYMAGRLRTKSISVHTSEVKFRDTAHGFLTWALASLLSAMLITSMIFAVISGGASVVSGAAKTAMGNGASIASIGSSMINGGANKDTAGYDLEALFRKNSNSTSTTGNADSTSTNFSSLATDIPEVASIMMNSMDSKKLSAEDLQYLTNMVAERTGLSPQESQVRVNNVFNAMQGKMVAAREVAEKARKASAYATLWLFGASLIGLIAACMGASWGGRRRDY